jgi:hypothetical protein
MSDVSIKPYTTHDEPALLIGALALICVPEWLLGKYVRRIGAG